jgi:hemerythrin
MIVWTKDFETGLPSLDQQHRLLIDNVNLLADKLRTANPTKDELGYVADLVDYLEAYADIHFKNEEQCMKKSRCSAHAQNREQHEQFRGFIRDYKRLCDQQGFNLQLLRNLHHVMDSWIRDHILKIDTQLKPCISEVTEDK